MSANKKLSGELIGLFNEYSSNNDAIEIISLATTDGFPVHHFSRLSEGFDVETMAAAASTLYSVSNAVTKQILSKSFKITFIESEQGNVAFVALQLNERILYCPCRPKAP